MESNFDFILFTVLWQPTFPLLFLTDQNTDCCSLHKQHNNCVTITWAQVLYAAVALNPSVTAKIILLQLRKVTGCLSYSCFNAYKGNSNTNTAAHSDTVVIAAVTHRSWFTSKKKKIIGPASIWNISIDWPVSRSMTVTKAWFSLRYLRQNRVGVNFQYASHCKMLIGNEFNL